jgi:hypothetical protein
MVNNAAMQDRRSTANIKPVSRGLAASQARYAGQARTMAPSGKAVPLPAAPTPPTPPTPVGDGPGQVQYGAQTVANPAPFNIDEVPIETLEKTPEYLARERAIQNQLDLFTQGQATGRTRFDEDLKKSYTELGYDPTSGKFDLGELLSSGQRATVAGRAYDALRNDFAARGMLQSGAYQARRGVLDTDLMGRAQSLEKSGRTFGEDQTAALVAQQEQAKAQRAAALDEARQALMVRMGMGG